MGGLGSGRQPNGNVNKREKDAPNERNIKNMLNANSDKQSSKTAHEQDRDWIKSVTDNIQKDLTNHIKNELSNLLKDEIKNLKDELLTATRSTISEIVLEEMQERDKIWKNENKVMFSKIKELEEREELRARNEKKNNIIIKGVKFSNKNLKEEVKCFIKEKLGIEPKIIIETRNIKINNDDFITIVKLDNFEIKLEIMSKKKQLKGTNIYINNDFTKRERDRQRAIMKIADEEKQKGNRVRVGYSKLIINGNLKMWKDGVGLIDCEQKANISSANSSFRD